MSSSSKLQMVVFAAVSSEASASENLRALCMELAKASGKIVVPHLLPTYAALAKQVMLGTVHVAWAPPLVALDLEEAGAAVAVLCSVRAGRAAYHAALFTRRDSTLHALGDLNDRHVAWVDRESSAGYVIPRLKLASAGLDPSRVFSRESFMGSHAAVGRAVARGDADVGATYLSLDPRTHKVLWAGWRDADVPTDDIRILATAGPIPADVIVLSARLSAEASESLTRHLGDLGRTAQPALKSLLHAEGVERVQPSHFEGLKRLISSQPKAR